MNSKNPMTLNSLKNTFLAAAVALVAAGCGSAGPVRSSQTTLVGAAGATLRTAAVTVTIPAGALSSEVQVTLREAEPHHAGRAVRVELEPNDLPLAATALVSVRVDDRNGRVKMVHVENEVEHLVQVELEDPNHHSYKTTMDRLGTLEVEVEHARVCAAACAANVECDDGACKPHGGAAANPAPGTAPTPAACQPGCATGLECDDGVCKPHGGK